MSCWSVRIQRYLSLLVIVGVCAAAGIFYRTYSLRVDSNASIEQRVQRAERIVRERVEAQIRTQLAKKIPASDLEDAVAFRVDQVIASDAESHKRLVDQTIFEISDVQTSYYSPKYLLGADSYYYYALTKNVLKTGKLGAKSKHGRFFNPMRRAPAGNYDFINLHPYIGAAGYRLFGAFLPGDLMQFLCYVPLFLTVLIVLAGYGLTRVMRLGFIPSLYSLLILVLSPIVIQRSTYGWYDTDPYNVLFPLLILMCFMAVVSGAKHMSRYGVAGGILTGLYSLFWNGWAFIFFLVIGVSCVFIITDLFSRKTKPYAKAAKYLGFYVLSSCAAGLICRTPYGFVESIYQAFSFVFKTAGAEVSVWPNLFLLIGETNAVSPEKLIQMTANLPVYWLILTGIIIEITRCAILKDVMSLRRVFAIVIISVPLFLLSMKAERFSLLAAIPVFLGAGIAFSGIGNAVHLMLSRFPLPAVIRKCGVSILLAGLAVMMLSPTLVSAHVAANIKPSIMNDIWAGALGELKEKSPEDAIVFSWWSPGHFVPALAERRVAVDGGGQALKENYWIARALMTSDEKESQAIFRMLASGGNGALEFLEKRAWRTHAAILLIDEILKIDRKNAVLQLPGYWTEEDKETFLDLIYHRGEPPAAYVLLYNDLVEKNIILQMLHRWDFEKAKTMRRTAGGFSGVFMSFFKNTPKAYFDGVFEAMGEPMPYQRNLSLQEKREDKLLFEQGVIVNTQNEQAFMPLKIQQRTVLEPLRTLIPGLDGTIQDKKPPQSLRKIAVLLEKLGADWSPTLLHEDLLDTVLFKLYYFQGRDTRNFKRIIYKNNAARQTQVQLYQILWNSK